MDLRKSCELVEVRYENEKQKAVMTFLDIENGEVLEINFNKEKYDRDKKKFVEDPQKAEQVDEWCKECFDSTFDNLTDQVGEKKDVYVYERFNSLWESKETKKFSLDDQGKFFQTKISNIEDDGFGIHIYFEYKGDEYESKMMYSDYIEALRKWFVNPQKKQKQNEKFESLFGVPVERAEEIVGNDISVEVKVAFNKYPYCEIKRPDWS